MQRTTLILAIGIALNVQIICGIPLTIPKFTYECPNKDNCYKKAYKIRTPCTKQSDCDGFGLLELACCPHRCGSNEEYRNVCTHLERVTAPPPTGTPICGESNPKDILFVVDGSVNHQQHWKETEKQFEKLKTFLKQVISGLKGENYRIGVMQFGGRSDPKMEIEFSDKTNMAQLLSHVDLIKQQQGVERKTGEALAKSSNELYEMNTIYDRYNAQDIIVLITRGDAWDREQAQREIKMLQRKYVRVIVIGVNPHPETIKSYLMKFVSSSRDLHLTKYKNLGDRKDAVLQGICSSPAIAPAVVSPCQHKKYDIFFAIDGSASINYKNFEKKKKLLRDLLVSLFPDETADMHIGLMQFAEQSKTEQLLEIGKHSLKTGLNVVKRMEYQSGKKTMLGDALSGIDRKVFNGRGGDRSDVKDILVIFSDGQAHDLSKALVQAENIKKKGVRVITIAARANAYLNELSKMASKQKYSLNVKLTDASYYAEEIASLICHSD